MPTKNLLRLLQLLMSMMMIVLATALLQIWKLRFGHYIYIYSYIFFETLSTRFGQDFEVEDLKLELGEYFAADVL